MGNLAENFSFKVRTRYKPPCFTFNYGCSPASDNLAAEEHDYLIGRNDYPRSNFWVKTLFLKNISAWKFILGVPSGKGTILLVIVVQSSQERDRRLPVAGGSSLDLPLIKRGITQCWKPPCATDTLLSRKFLHGRWGDPWVSRFPRSSQEGNPSDACI